MTSVIGALLVVVSIQAAATAALLIQAARHKRAARALREHEECFRLRTDRAPVMFWTAQADTKLDYVNNTCVEFTGLPVDKLLGAGWQDAVHPEDLAPLSEIYIPAVEAQVPFCMEYRMRRADGVFRWVLDSAVPSYGPDGSYAGHVGCCIDITERKVAEDQMRHSRDALDLSHREIQQLAERLITAHEDERRRLAGELHDDITQRLALLAIDAGRLERTGRVDIGALTTLRGELVRLSEDVHALSYRLHPSLLDDLGLIEAIRAECDRVARCGELRVEVKSSSPLVALTAEASLCLFRVTQEALRNVARHAKASEVTVFFLPNRTGLQVAVSDNGCGFDMSQPRARASLGLISMRERVRMLRGDISIESAPGHGTTVTAWIPLGGCDG